MNLFLNDLPTMLQWYVPIVLLGIVFLPLTTKIFGSFFDRGYAFSKILGILLTSYTLWLLGTLHLFPFTTASLFIVVAVFFIINIFLLNKTNPKQSPSGKPKRLELGFASIELHKSIFSLNLPPGLLPVWILEEVIFFVAFLFWVYIRGHEPSIHGLEKFMDYGFMQSIFNSRFFPPQDMWLAPSDDPRYTGGFFINYYYFGHYVTAFLSKLTSVPLAKGYNLMLASIFAFCFGQSFAIGAQLWNSIRTKVQSVLTYKMIVTGLLAAFLVTIAGNLHTIYVFTHGYENEHPVPFWGIMKLGATTSYWYPNATRFIPNTIHEFPIYSWVVADLHGHVLDIPFVLLTLAYVFVVFNLIRDGTFGKRHIAFIGFLTAVMFMTNAWDGLIYAILAVSLLFLFYLARKMHLKQFLVLVGMLGISFVLFNLPFSMHFKPFVHGFGVVGGWEIVDILGLRPAIEKLQPVPLEQDVAVQSFDSLKLGPFLLEKGNNLRSPLWMMGVLWGFFYFFVGMGLLILVKRIRSTSLVGVMNDIVHTLSANNHDSFKKRLSENRVIHSTDIFLGVLIVISTLLLIFPELFYAKDIYPGHYRANTMFKLGYQAFIMLSLFSAYAIVRLKSFFSKKGHFTPLKIVFYFITIPFLILVAIYPYFAIESYYGVTKYRDYDGLDGTVWLKTDHPGDYETIQWFNEIKRSSDQKIKGSKELLVVLEAVGDSYTDYARISAYTGLPTILGWPVHEWLWRGSYDEPGPRVEEVKQIYEGVDETAVRTLLDKYSVDYMVIGKLEREKYPALNEALLVTLGTEVFQSGETAVYEITE